MQKWTTDHGSPEAQDFPLQYTASPVAVEGNCAHARELCALPRTEVAAHRVPNLRNLRQASGT